MRLSRRLTMLTLAWILPGTMPSQADTLMEYQVENGKHSGLQSVIIKNGTVLVKAAGGDRNLDILYQRLGEHLVLIDHKQQRFTPVTAEKVGRMARQVEDAQPLVRGLSEQLRKLSPKQKAKWEQMLGGISLAQLDQFNKATHEVAATKLVKAGPGKTVTGIACERMEVFRDGARAAEFCLADPKALRLSEDDATTLRSLIGFTQRLAQKAQSLTAQFGIDLPALAALAGVPVEIQEYNVKHPKAMSLSRVGKDVLPETSLEVPEGYRARELSWWP